MTGDRFRRTRLLIGQEGLDRLAEARVLVVGLGAVGSFAVEALARSGVGCLRLVDSDTVEESNCNRQLFALTSTIGHAKCQIARNRVLDINPNCTVDARQCFADAKSIPGLIEDRPDIVIDAIDSLSSKVDLIAAAVEAGLPVISSMGAARKRDPSMIRVADIAQTSVCPLAAAVRQKLRKRGVNKAVTCVYSTEPAAPDSIERPQGDATVENLHARAPMGSLPTITGIFGLMLANAALDRLLAD